MRLLTTMKLLGSSPYNVITGLSGAGLIETGFLSYQKVAQNVPLPFCGEVAKTGASSCTDVLSGPYSVLPVFDIPLIYFAFASYATVAFLSNYMADQSSNENSSKSQKSVGNFLLGLTACMGSFSVYLMVVLTSVLHTQCMYCYISAFLSISMAAISYLENIVPNRTTAAVIGASSVTVTSMFSAFIFYITSSTAVSASTVKSSLRVLNL